MNYKTQLGVAALALAMALPSAALQNPQGNQQKGNRPATPPSSRGFQGPGPHNGDWLRKNMNTPPAKQKQELESSPQFKQLPPQEQQKLVNRLNRFNAMSPQQKNRVLTHMEWLEHLSPEQKKKADDLHQQFHGLSQDRRIAVRRALFGMRDMNQDERQKQIDSPQMKKDYNEQERQIMKGYTDLGFPDAHAEENTADNGGSPQEDM